MDKIYIGMVDCARGDEQQSLAEACLDAEETGRFDRLRQPLGRRCFVEGRRLARQMTARLTGVAPEALACAIDPEGKPCFPALGDWHFNISHSGTLVACVCAPFRLGLDIELHKPGRNRLEVAERFFSPAEFAAIRAAPERFYHYWTLKEAWLKWHGIGLSGLSTVPEYGFEPAVAHGKPESGSLSRLDGSAMDGLFAVWDLTQESASATRWAMALACGQAWRLEWDGRFGIPAGCRLVPVYRNQPDAGAD